MDQTDYTEIEPLLAELSKYSNGANAHTVNWY